MLQVELQFVFLLLQSLDLVSKLVDNLGVLFDLIVEFAEPLFVFELEVVVVLGQCLHLVFKIFIFVYQPVQRVL